MKIGLVGLGRMGGALARRLHEKSFDVIAFDQDPSRCAPANPYVSRLADSPKEVAEASDVVISIVTDDSSVRSVFSGNDGFLQADIAGKLFVEMSTIQPMTIRALAPIVETRGAGLVDSPVLGSVPAVIEGKLIALVGGKASHVDRSRPLLEALTRKIAYLGPSGSGSTMKLAVNLTMAAYLQSLAEALALGHRRGLSIESMLDILLDAPTANGWLKTKLELLKGGHSDITLDIRTLRKDVMCAIATASLTGVPMPAGGGILSSLSAAVAAGQGDSDLGVLPSFFREFMLQNVNDDD